ncbi:peptidylprolyl isomerase [Pseudoponticoccus marisrubri]|uniref:Parvulin-like PPIase n=2 Tax=Pseudoponticoccus marisrubri TaxID=1685382 RepID=A0A0W7WJL5_9RHOB|nr:peptidylprolyl isomerase [Pseudoponticoccus marisrubri]
MKATVTALCLGLAAPALAQDETVGPDTVVATVNGTEITVAHMLMARASLPEQYQQLPADNLWDGILNQLVQQEVLSQDDAAEETLRVRTALDNERRSLMAGEVIAQVAQDAVTDEAIAAAYEADYADAEQGLEFNASHILVESEEEAQAIVQELADGADFAETAREKSTGPSGANGGALNWFSAGMMVQPFQDAVEALEVGQVSDPVKTQFGWHVIKLNETRPMEAPALESVRGEIATQLQQEAVTSYIETLVDDAEITRTGAAEIDTSVLGNMGLLEE